TLVEPDAAHEPVGVGAKPDAQLDRVGVVRCRHLGHCVFRLSAAWTGPGAHVHRDRGAGVADVAAVVDGAGTQRRRTEWTRDPLVGPRGVSFGGMPRGAVVG